MKIFVTGASGLLGANLCYLFNSRHEIHASYLHHPVQIPNCKTYPLDITDEKELRELLIYLKPNLIIHAAANASVENCEKNPDQAYQLNVTASGDIAKIAKKIKARMIYISTDSVFTETREKPFSEDEPTNPKSVYSKTKLEGECRVSKELADALIVRTCIYGFNCIQKMNLAEWILDSLKRNEKIQGFADIYFTPILVNDLYVALERAIEKKLSGVFHIASNNAVSKYEFACSMARTFGLASNLILKSSIGKSELKAFRPLRPCLDVSKFQRATKQTLPTVQQGIEHFYKLHHDGYPEQVKKFGLEGSLESVQTHKKLV